MTLWQRFQRLTLWNKIAVASSLASSVGLVVAALAFFPIPDKTQRQLFSRWREMRACNGNACGESKSQNSHERLLDLTFSIFAASPKLPIY